MEEYKGRCASSGKEKMHEQSYPHPKPSVLPWYAAALVFAVRARRCQHISCGRC